MNSAIILLSFLDNIINLVVDSFSLYFDLKEVKLDRHCFISIISLYVLFRKKIYFINIHRLEKVVFSITNSSATSFKIILESSIILKVIFNIRNDSDVLFNHYEIFVDDIKDLQLMKLATRKDSKNFVTELVKCIEKNSSVSIAAKAKWQRTKENANRLYESRKNDRYEIFNERFTRSEIVQYCARDVALLPKLYNVYNVKLRLSEENFEQVQVREATKDRIKLSQSSGYDKQAKTKVCESWDKKFIEQVTDDWNDDVMFNALNNRL